MRLTMKAIIRWEQLNQKPFSLLNYNNEDEIISLFYTCSLSDGITSSLSEFKEKQTEESLKQMIQDFEKQTSFNFQFQVKTSEDQEESTEDQEDSNPIYIKDIVPMLVMNGLDIHFALNEMELCDLQIYTQAHDKKVKHDLEYARLWAFLQVSPHLSPNIKSPKDLVPFGWELKEIRAKAKIQLEKDEALFEAFYNSDVTLN